MTFARLKATGSGQLRWRVSIDGFPIEAVSTRDMEQDTTDPTAQRLRRVGLVADDIKISEDVDMVLAKARHSGFGLRIVDIGGAWSQSFFREPDVITRLTGGTTIDAADTTITVLSTAGFPDTGAIWINRECIYYGGTTATTFTSCQRAQLGTLDVNHYTDSFAAGGVTLPEVTAWPRTIEGQRVRVYAYGEGDDPQGDGTSFWVGVARTDVRWDGSAFRILVDPLWSITESEIGGDIDESSTIRGIYYPRAHPLLVRVTQRSSSARDGGAINATTGVALAGFFETFETFRATLRAAIATAMATPISGTFETGVKIDIVRTEDVPSLFGIVDPEADRIPIVDLGDWAFAIVYDTSTSWITVDGPNALIPGRQQSWLSDVDGSVYGSGISPLLDWMLRGDGVAVGSVAVGETYYRPLVRRPDSAIERPGSIPRTVYYPDSASELHPAALAEFPVAYRIGMGAGENPAGRLYVSADPSAASAVAIEWDKNGRTMEDDVTLYSSVETNATDNWIRLRVGPGTGYITTPEDPQQPLIATAGNAPEIRLGRRFVNAAGVAAISIIGLIESIQDSTRELLNRGIGPDIRPQSVTGTPSDFDVTSIRNNIGPALTGDLATLRSGRSYLYFSPIDVGKLLEEEMKLVGGYPALNADGRLTVRRLRHIADSEAEVATLDSSNIVVSEGWLQIERSGFGLFNTMELKTGYDPIEDAHEGKSYTARDLRAVGYSGLAASWEIAPMSGDNPALVMRPSTAVRVAQPVTSVFGVPYLTATVRVTQRLLDVLVGDVVVIDWEKIPDEDGRIQTFEAPTAPRVGWVVSRSWEPMAAHGTMTIYLPGSRRAGYAPEAEIASITGTSGTTGPFALTLEGRHFPTDTDAENFWSIGDRVRLYRFASTLTTNARLGLVTAVNGLIVTVQPVDGSDADVTWTHADADWVLAPRNSTDVETLAQKRYAYIARGTGRIEWKSGSVPESSNATRFGT